MLYYYLLLLLTRGLDIFSCLSDHYACMMKPTKGIGDVRRTPSNNNDALLIGGSKGGKNRGMRRGNCYLTLLLLL